MSLDGRVAARQASLRARERVRVPHKGLLEGLIEPGEPRRMSRVMFHI